MARITYRQREEFRLFGLKVLEKFTDYYEHSTDRDSSEDDENIELTKRIVERND